MSAYRGATFALLTQHGKERVVAPLLASAFDARVELVRGFDTDALGTFTREVPRLGTQLEAARTKARRAMELSRIPLGLGSEGAFVPIAFGAGVVDVELVVLLDAVCGVEIVGRAQGAGHHLARYVSTLEQLFDFARASRFPSHALVLRPEHPDHHDVVKGLSSWHALGEAFRRAVASSSSGVVFVESDLRAHQNPTRMALIREAMADCVRRMDTPCPACGLPGFGVVETVSGLRCGECGAPTRRARAETWGCVKCAHAEERPLAVEAADPSACDACNP